MKPIAGTILVGVLIALGVIYYLRPLNYGAVALVLVLSVGLAGVLGKALAWLLRRGKRQ